MTGKNMTPSSNPEFERTGWGIVALIGSSALLLKLLVINYDAHFRYYIGFAVAFCIFAGMLKFLSPDVRITK